MAKPATAPAILTELVVAVASCSSVKLAASGFRFISWIRLFLLNSDLPLTLI